MNFIKAAVVERKPESVIVEGKGIGRVTLPFRGFAPAGGSVTLGIRPEHAGLGGDPARRIAIPATLAFVEELGDMTYVHGDLPSGERLVLRSLEGRYAGGNALTATVDPARILLFDESGRRVRPAA
jgi:lactose/L-arabinose transport system ATP-binding protein